ncbi:MAG: transcriptional regulator, partial [Nitrosomonas sp.]
MDNTIAMRRLEIVIGIEQLEELMTLLGKSGVKGYTIIKNAGGYGSRGTRDPHDVIMDEENVVVILACKEDQAQIVVGQLRPVMKRMGG